MSTVGDSDLLLDAAWLLTGVERQGFTFTRTTRDVILKSAFVDGRTPLSVCGRIATLSWERAFALHSEPREKPSIVMHVGFCGSTLLTRLLDAACVALTYREPQALIDLSVLKSGYPPETWDELVTFVTSQFSKRFNSHEPAILKPSNWVVNLAEDWVRLGASIVFMGMPPEGYLVSVLRGGRARLAFMLKFLSELRKTVPGAAPIIEEIERDASIDETQRTLRFILAALAIQEREFERVMKLSTPEKVMRTTHKDLSSNPRAVIAAVRRHFGLQVRDSLDDAFAQVASRHAKAESAAFDLETEAATNALILEKLRDEIERALAWYESYMGAV